jgi:hypothetical protein
MNLEENTNLPSSLPDEDNENPIITSISDSMFKVATNFTKDEFKILFSDFDEDITRLQINRGPKTKLSSMDKFFILITHLNSYTKLACDFGLSSSYLQKLIETMIIGLSKKFAGLYIKFITGKSK